MVTVIVTGGIGSGKSEFCRILEDRFAVPVYEADIRAKELYVTSPGLLDELESVLGVCLRDENGCFVPALLAQEIFSDNGSLQKVEEILFPYMKDDFREFAEGKELVVFESATVLEKTAFKGFGDYVILVDAPYDVRLARASARDGADKEKIRKRMSAQKLMNKFSELSSGYGHSETVIPDPVSEVDEIILNCGTFQDLEESAVGAFERILNKFDMLNYKQ